MGSVKPFLGVLYPLTPVTWPYLPVGACVWLPSPLALCEQE